MMKWPGVRLSKDEHLGGGIKRLATVCGLKPGDDSAGDALRALLGIIGHIEIRHGGKLRVKLNVHDTPLLRIPLDIIKTRKLNTISNIQCDIRVHNRFVVGKPVNHPATFGEITRIIVVWRLHHISRVLKAEIGKRQHHLGRNWLSSTFRRDASETDRTCIKPQETNLVPHRRFLLYRPYMRYVNQEGADQHQPQPEAVPHTINWRARLARLTTHL